MQKLFIFFLPLLLIFSMNIPAYSKENKKIYEEYAYTIQNKIFHKHHEVGLDFSYVTNDIFYEVFPYGGHYTYNFNEHFSWEVARFQGTRNSEKSIRKTIEEIGLVFSESFEPKYFFHSSLLFRPLYGKDVFLNKGILNKESYFSIGAGIVQYQRLSSESSGLAPKDDNTPSYAFGIGTKYFLNKSFALNIDLKDMICLRSDKTVNYIFVSFALVYRFNLTSRKIKKNPEVEKLKRYFKSNDK